MRFPMSLRRSSYVAPKSPKGASKTQNGRFLFLKNALRLTKVCYKVSLCENCQRQSCKAFIGLTKCAKNIGGGDPLYQKFWIKVTALCTIADFRPIFARRASAVTASEKSSINANSKSYMGFRLVPNSVTLNDLALEAHFRLTRTEMTRDQTRVLQ